DGGLDHATYHDHHAVRPGHGDHPQCFTETAALGQLDIDTVYRTDQGRNVGGDQAALVRDHRDARDSTHRGQPVEIMRRKALLHHRHAELFENREHTDRLLPGPAAVGVPPQLLVGGAADGAENLVVAVGPELHLEHGVGLRLEHLRPHLVRCVEPDGKGGD